MSYWKRHYFVYLSSGDLLYFRDETLNELQGRVDVRHAPTVRVTGEHLLEEKKKDGIFKFSKALSLEREDCLVWIATPPSKMFVLKVQEDHESPSSGLSNSIGPGTIASATARKVELSPTAKFVPLAPNLWQCIGMCLLWFIVVCRRKWLALLLKGHAQTKYTQLEKCVANGTFDTTPEVGYDAIAVDICPMRWTDRNILPCLDTRLSLPCVQVSPMSFGDSFGADSLEQVSSSGGQSSSGRSVKSPRPHRFDRALQAESECLQRQACLQLVRDPQAGRISAACTTSSRHRSTSRSQTRPKVRCYSRGCVRWRCRTAGTSL